MADQKISALDEKTRITKADLLVMVDTEASPIQTKMAESSNVIEPFLEDIYHPDFGLKWADLGVVTTDGVYTIAYLGNGIAVIGDEGGHVWRSTDFGLTWADLGAIASSDIFTIANLGNGIVVLGVGDFHIFRSTDYGLTWADLGAITTAAIYAMAYLGNGVVVLGDGDYHVWRSTDYGANWADLGVITGHNINRIIYLGSGIAVIGAEDGHVWRSTDYGANWADLGQIATRAIYSGAYLGNGIAVLGDEDDHVWRSIDDGANWTDLGVIASNSIWAIEYLGNGVVVLGDQSFHIYRSTDYGANWTDLGVIAAASFYAIAYLGNGVVVAGGDDDHVYRSTSAFQVWDDGMPPLDDFLENPPTEDLATKAPTSEWAFDHDAATTGVHGAGANTLWHGGLTNIVDKTHLSQDFGTSSARLNNIILTPLSGKILGITAATTSPFSGAIDDNAGAHGGQGLDATHVPYDGDSNEDMFSGLQTYNGTTYWGQIVLHNTTRSNSRKIVSVDRANNVITTTSSTDDWADDDVITCQSQTNAQAGYFDVDLSDNVAATDTGILMWAAFTDKEGNDDASRYVMFHTYEAYDNGKRFWLTAYNANEQNGTTTLLPIVSQKMTMFLGSGCNGVDIAISVLGTSEYADT